eukprot:6189837-Pleurochrysis_carterae.AAC.4
MRIKHSAAKAYNMTHRTADKFGSIRHILHTPRHTQVHMLHSPRQIHVRVREASLLVSRKLLDGGLNQTVLRAFMRGKCASSECEAHGGLACIKSGRSCHVRNGYA